MAAAYSAGVCAVRKCSPGIASTPPAAIVLATTGTPSAMASRILFCVPRAMLSGATINAERRRYGRTSGTEPVTVTPDTASRRRTAGDGSAPTMNNRSPGRRRRSNGKTLRTELEHAFLIRVIVHASDERDGVRIVRLAGRREIIGIHAVRKPVRRRAGAIALQRLPFGARRRRADIEAARETLFLARPSSRPPADSRGSAGTACNARIRAISASPCRRNRGSSERRRCPRHSGRPTSNARRSGRTRVRDERADAAGKCRRMEEADRRGRGGRQARDHARHLRPDCGRRPFRNASNAPRCPGLPLPRRRSAQATPPSRRATRAGDGSC